jgi:hypothetical protein
LEASRFEYSLYSTLRFYEEINLSTWLAAKPASIVEDKIGLSKAMVDKLPGKLVGFTAPG